MNFLKNFLICFLFIIPHRIEEGYGLNKEAITKAKNQGISFNYCFLTVAQQPQKKYY